MRIPVTIFGILLVAVGTAVPNYGRAAITTMERQLPKIGPFSAGTAEGRRVVSLPPTAGGIILTAGAVLILGVSIEGHKRNSSDHTEASS